MPNGIVRVTSEKPVQTWSEDEFIHVTPSFFFARNIMSDDEQHEHTFDAVGAGASLTYPMQCSALRKKYVDLTDLVEFR
jgi:hypothetical protein